MIQPAKRLGEVKEYYFSRKLKELAKMRADGKNIINLGIGSPDLAPSSHIIETLISAVKDRDNHAYQSYIGIPELRSAFSKWYSRYFEVKLDSLSEILPLIGSKEGIMHISMAYLEEGDEVLIPNPGYPTYRAASRLAGATIMEYDLSEKTDWLPDLAALEKKDLSNVKIMWVNYPNMPTGKNAPFSFFKKLIAFAKRHQILIVNDNPYSFILNKKPMSLLAVEGAMEVAMELNSLSKSHNMAGWRIGMLAGKSEYVQTVLRFKSNMDSGMFKPVQLAAIEALNQPSEWYANLNKIYTQRREKVYQLLDKLNCIYDKEKVGLFVWAKIPNNYQISFELTDEILTKHHIFITPGSIFGSNGDKYIRIALCGEIETFEEAIKRISSKQTFKTKQS